MSCSSPTSDQQSPVVYAAPPPPPISPPYQISPAVEPVPSFYGPSQQQPFKAMQDSYAPQLLHQTAFQSYTSQPQTEPSSPHQTNQQLQHQIAVWPSKQQTELERGAAGDRLQRMEVETASMVPLRKTSIQVC
ncbi:unnamed protein product [Gongylonema pulchrum]|uniref:DAZ-associated protein 2 n=1 Tax=Gongylonema pulchrum TaxID=637853 RepID=A0A183CZ49_9BILA|nr:unnamed protein product [Gongylonema pulchrum]